MNRKLFLIIMCVMIIFMLFISIYNYYLDNFPANYKYNIDETVVLKNKEIGVVEYRWTSTIKKRGKLFSKRIITYGIQINNELEYFKEKDIMNGENK